jgi:hypothetical protein
MIASMHCTTFARNMTSRHAPLPSQLHTSALLSFSRLAKINLNRRDGFIAVEGSPSDVEASVAKISKVTAALSLHPHSQPICGFSFFP